MSLTVRDLQHLTGHRQRMDDRLAINAAIHEAHRQGYLQAKRDVRLGRKARPRGVLLIAVCIAVIAGYLLKAFWG